MCLIYCQANQQQGIHILKQGIIEPICRGHLHCARPASSVAIPGEWRFSRIVGGILANGIELVEHTKLLLALLSARHKSQCPNYTGQTKEAIRNTFWTNQLIVWWCLEHISTNVCCFWIFSRVVRCTLACTRFVSLTLWALISLIKALWAHLSSYCAWLPLQLSCSPVCISCHTMRQLVSWLGFKCQLIIYITS